MPEGDTIHRLAGRLRPALEGQPLVRFSCRRVPRPWPSPGPAIRSVDAAGKHLLVTFGDGWSLETHLGMNGAWLLARPGDRWRRPAAQARAEVEVADWVAVCFAAPTVRLVRTAAAGVAAPTSVAARLGPDLCRPDADMAAVVGALGALPPGTPVGDAVLDQRVMAGVGNVFRSEILFACGLHPATPVADLDDAGRAGLVEVAARMLRRNLGPGPRTTVPGPPGSLAVYGRSGQRCRRCGTPLASGRVGRHRRLAWWCPACQPEPA